VLKVRVLSPSGFPIAGATIDALCFRPGMCTSGYWDAAWHCARTDAAGRADFEPRELPRIRELRLSVRSEALAGELLLRRPYDGEEHVLTLAPAAWIDLFVHDELGAPVFGAETGAGIAIENEPQFVDWKSTGPDGGVRLGPFHAGPHGLVVWSPFDQRKVTQRLDLETGRATSVTVALDHGGRSLAVAGRVIQAPAETFTGRLGSLDYRIDGGSWDSIECRVDGSFEVWSAPGQEIELRGPAHVQDVACEPARQRVPFGATNLVFRALPRTTSDLWRIEIRDRASGEPILNSHLYLTRFEDDRELGGGQLLPTGVREPELPQGREVWVIAIAHGYRECVKRLPASASLTLTLELDRGMTRHVRIRAGRDGPGIPDAWLRIGAAVLAITDAGGRADFTLDDVPGFITIEADGYESKGWDPRRQSASAERETIELRPREPDGG
jgi:hypothetical protein